MIDLETTDIKLRFDDTSTAFSSQNNRELQKTHFLFTIMNNPNLVKVGTSLAKWAFQLRLPIKSIVKNTVFSHFCGGESIDDCKYTIEQLGNYNIKTILDYAVEGTKDEASFDTTTTEILATIKKAANSPYIPFSVFKPTGIASFEILEKIHTLQTLTPEEEKAFERIKERFDTICSTAFKYGVKIMVDAEESWIQHPVDLIVEEMMQKYNKEQPIVFNTYQLYLSGTLSKLERDLNRAKNGSYYLGAKLVRGAYLEKERERAEENCYPDPTQFDKHSCDTDYNSALQLCINNIAQAGLVAATHNENSSNFLVSLMRQKGIPNNSSDIYFAQLYGMSDHISYNLANAGYNVVKYVPYGPVQKVMPYLFRRAEENTSIAGQSSRELKLIREEIARRNNPQR